MTHKHLWQAVHSQRHQELASSVNRLNSRAYLLRIGCTAIQFVETGQLPPAQALERQQVNTNNQEALCLKLKKFAYYL
jgi:hypothetical protein